MGHTPISKEEIARRGQILYDQQIRMTVEPDHAGQFLIIEIGSGDFEVDSDEFAASRRAHAKHPNGLFFGMRLGRRSSGTIGAPVGGHGVRIEKCP